MVLRRSIGLSLALCAGISLLPSANAQQERHGRKYKAPPPTSHIVVTVVKSYNGKPIQNAAVVFHPMKDGKSDGNLELKTDPKGKATIDIIPTGSQLLVQVIAPGFATFAQTYQVAGPDKEISIGLVRPEAQVSAYVDNLDEPSKMKPGVQEPIRPKPQTAPVTKSDKDNSSHSTDSSKSSDSASPKQ